MNDDAKPKATPAIRFLWVIAGLTLLAVLGAVGFRLFQPQIMRWALVPHHPFTDDKPDAEPDYTAASTRAWVAHPAFARDPARASPPGFRAAPRPPVDVFFVPPTTYLENAHWNAPLDGAETNRLLDQVARHFASAFNGIGAIYMPRYRQATFGTFLTDGGPDALAALDLAYGDVLRAYDAFQRARDPNRPFILAAHSQGSLHLLRLLKERIGGKPAARQMVAAYVVGWPLSVQADLEPLGLRACETPQATGCVLSWQSYGASGADASRIENYFQTSSSFSGVPRKGSKILCTNPLNWWTGSDQVAREANLGALPFAKTGRPMLPLMPAYVAAQCRGDGILLVSPNPGAPFDERMLPGANYHAYDYTLFWANLRANAEARVSAFAQPR